jgi:hypothetical protein
VVGRSREVTKTASAGEAHARIRSMPPLQTSGPRLIQWMKSGQALAVHQPCPWQSGHACTALESVVPNFEAAHCLYTPHGSG